MGERRVNICSLPEQQDTVCQFLGYFFIFAINATQIEMPTHFTRTHLLKKIPHEADRKQQKKVRGRRVSCGRDERL